VAGILTYPKRIRANHKLTIWVFAFGRNANFHAGIRVGMFHDVDYRITIRRGIHGKYIVEIESIKFSLD
jgi:hypothetical protein